MLSGTSNMLFIFPGILETKYNVFTRNWAIRRISQGSHRGAFHQKAKTLDFLELINRTDKHSGAQVVDPQNLSISSDFPHFLHVFDCAKGSDPKKLLPLQQRFQDALSKFLLYSGLEKEFKKRLKIQLLDNCLQFWSESPKVYIEFYSILEMRTVPIFKSRTVPC